MRFSSIMNPPGSQTKTAAATATDAAVKSAAQQVQVPAPPAQAATPVVTKLAEELVAGNRDAEAQHALKLGHYLFQGFLEAHTAYESAATKLANDKAAEMAVTAEELELVRMLRNNPEDFMQRGMAFAESKLANDKESQAAYDETVQNTLQGFRKVAAEHYAAGYNATIEALQ